MVGAWSITIRGASPSKFQRCSYLPIAGFCATTLLSCKITLATRTSCCRLRTRSTSVRTMAWRLQLSSASASASDGGSVGAASPKSTRPAQGRTGTARPKQQQEVANQGERGRHGDGPWLLPPWGGSQRGGRPQARAQEDTEQEACARARAWQLKIHNDGTTRTSPRWARRPRRRPCAPSPVWRRQRRARPHEAADGKRAVGVHGVLQLAKAPS